MCGVNRAAGRSAAAVDDDPDPLACVAAAAVADRRVASGGGGGGKRPRRPLDVDDSDDVEQPWGGGRRGRQRFRGGWSRRSGADDEDEEDEAEGGGLNGAGRMSSRGGPSRGPPGGFRPARASLGAHRLGAAGASGGGGEVPPAASGAGLAGVRSTLRPRRSLPIVDPAVAVAAAVALRGRPAGYPRRGVSGCPARWARQRQTRRRQRPPSRAGSTARGDPRVALQETSPR